MDAAIAGLIGAGLGVLGGLGSAWIAQHGQSRRWKLQRQDETYMLLGEWISENWEWAISLTSIGTICPNLPAPTHKSHGQVEVAVNLHASKSVDRLVDTYTQAFVSLDNANRAASHPELFPGSGVGSAYDNVRSLQDQLADAGAAVFEQMAKELRPSIRRVA